MLRQLLYVLLFLTAIALTSACDDNGKGNENKVQATDSLNYQSVYKTKVVGDTSKNDKSSLLVKLKYIQVSNTPAGDAVAKAINELAIACTVHGGDMETSVEYNTVDELINMLFRAYTETAADMADYAIPMEYESTQSVLFNNGNYFVISQFVYSSMGGAHPNTFLAYQNIDAKTGKVLPIEHFIADAQLEKLTALVEAAFRKEREITTGESWEELGFSFENNKFRLSMNYAITREGLAFYYNPYEVAAYALGPTAVTIPWEQVRPLLNKDIKL